MPTAKQVQPEANSKSLETEIERNVYDLKRAGTTFRPTDDGNHETAANLTTLLGRVSEASTCEIDNLIGELRGLRETVETDCDHLQNDIAEYAKLSQAVMQLTAVASDDVEKLPSAPRISQ
jgi:hypothetical protein